jgi:hypothetical protein
MNEVTKRVRFLVDGNDKNTGQHYPARTETELTRTENDFATLVEQGIVAVLDEE